MKLYLSLFRIRFLNFLQYRAVAVGLLATRFLWAFMEILAFQALYRSGLSESAMTMEQTASYLWMQQGLYTLFLVVFADGEIYDSIRTGTIAYELVRPMDLYDRWFVQAAANRAAPLVFGHLPMLLVALIMPAPMRLILPAFPQFLLFLLSAALGLCVTVSIAMFMHISMFFTVSHRGTRIMFTAITGFLSGGVIPLPFFPEAVRNVISLLPFAAMQNMPLQIFCGTMTGTEALAGILFQTVWLFILVFLGKLVMHRALQRVVVQGG